MRDNDTPKWFWALWSFMLLLSLAMTTGIVFVAWHFAAKYW